MKKKTGKFLVPALPRGVALEGCTVARASDGFDKRAYGLLFVKASDGTIYCNRRGAYWPLDLTDDWCSNAADRSLYARLAGIKVKDIDAARKQAKMDDQKEKDKRELDHAKTVAQKFGYKLTKSRGGK